MWILPDQLIQSHSLKVTEALSEALSLLDNELDQSLLVKSKPMPSRTLSQRWKKGHWIRTLFGRMPKPSQASNFLEKWIFSLEDSHVSHSVQQVEEKQMKTRVICGQLAFEQLNLFSPSEFSLKMSKDSSLPSWEEMNGVTQKGHQYCSMSAESWKDEVIKQRGEYSQRVKQARHIREKESLSSENWSTPNTMDELPQRSEESLRRQASTTRKGRTKPANLREQVNPRACEIYKEVNWPTPVVRDYQDVPSPKALIWKDGKSRLDTVPNVAMYGPQGQDNLNGEWKNLELNPNWVEQLMGLPTELTDLGYWGME